MNHCLRHYDEPITAHCRACKHPFCTRCLVYSFGPKKPPFCVGCALTASGVRNRQRAVASPQPAQTDDVAVPDKRAQRALQRAERAALKAAARDAKRAARKVTTPVPAPSADHSPAALPPAPAPGPLLARSSTSLDQI